MHWQTAVAAVLVATSSAVHVSAHVVARATSDLSRLLHYRHRDFTKQHRRDTEDVLEFIERRQSPSTASESSASAAPQSKVASTSNETVWDAQTESACNATLSALHGNASNPSGMAVCYNLPYLDQTHGVFQADLRLYRISPPTGVWAGIPSQDVSVDITYAGATVAAGTNKRRKRDHYPLSWPPIKREGTKRLGKRQTSSPQMLQVFNFVGQINSNMMSPSMSKSQLETLSMPDVILSAVSSMKGAINTTLSTKDASFVSGVFADQSSTVFASSSAAAGSAVTGPFVLPGTHLGIFPTGLIITASWTAIFVGVLSWGTMGRYQFRDHYRRRMKRGQATTFRRI
ncbi:MAG: hypothetical protein M1827_001882 [Pycnora praestabilis]|nr:MAG: hypothetical protein M1827_001882 [Pycnora praestabilis]